MNSAERVNIFAALAQESRLSVFKILVEHGTTGMCAGDISKKLNIAKNTLSFHLLLLTQAGLLKKRKEGLYIYYAVNFEAIKEVIDFLLVDCCNSECTCTTCNVFRDLEVKHHKKHQESKTKKIKKTAKK
ncbi:putative transcriptional regulator [Elusimicrobium minutum Pei191]|uniref:Putative transcriptional regulator n=1 Tax=Elusimicrobium minutum (strain Pei191) TaxID=445932 RepID=B2KD10_ELUMP|nr:helix-turn-helix transcriptional regulator [Elusimicrobium minutum]ACC98406.1 putative transcriptional regulator [Elusimicrobium minutum Pei191]